MTEFNDIFADGYQPEDAQRISDLIVEMFATAAQAMKDNEPVIVSTLTEIMNTILPPLVQVMADILVENYPIISEAASNMGVAIASGIIASIPKMGAAIAKSVVSMAAGLLDHDWNGTGEEALGGVSDGVTSFVANFSWSNIGRNMMLGIKAGIVNTATELASAARQAVSDAVEAAKNFLNINSPSRVTRDQIGAPFMEGVGAGFDKKSDEVKKNAVGSMKDAIKAMQSEASIGLVLPSATSGKFAFGGQSAVSNSATTNYIINYSGLCTRRPSGIPLRL